MIMNYYDSGNAPERDSYERDLRRRQEEHLRNIGRRSQEPWRPCMHDGCSECVGTGRKKDGTPCIHMISCPCPRCNPARL